jgi:hypothetical protein
MPFTQPSPVTKFSRMKNHLARVLQNSSPHIKEETQSKQNVEKPGREREHSAIMQHYSNLRMQMNHLMIL